MSSTTVSQSATQVFNRAAYLIDEFGWVQGILGDKRTGFCLIGALFKARRDLDFSPDDIDATTDPLGVALAETIHLLVASKVERPFEVAVWNDDPARTKENVVQLLRKAAKLTDKAPIPVFTQTNPPSDPELPPEPLPNPDPEESLHSSSRVVVGCL